MDANSGAPWSEMDISDLENELVHGVTVAKTASFLCRDENEVRQPAKGVGASLARKIPAARGIVGRNVTSSTEVRLSDLFQLRSSLPRIPALLKLRLSLI